MVAEFLLAKKLLGQFVVDFSVWSFSFAAENISPLFNYLKLQIYNGICKLTVSIVIVCKGVVTDVTVSPASEAVDDVIVSFGSQRVWHGKESLSAHSF